MVEDISKHRVIDNRIRIQAAAKCFIWICNNLHVLLRDEISCDQRNILNATHKARPECIKVLIELYQVEWPENIKEKCSADCLEYRTEHDYQNTARQKFNIESPACFYAFAPIYTSHIFERYKFLNHPENRQLFGICKQC